MILDSETSNSDTKIKDSNRSITNSKLKTLYIGMMCFATNCLSSITLESGLRGSFRSISSRPASFNNLFRRNYNLRIKTMVADVLAALISTTMLTIGDMHGIPYLYLPWLTNTIKGLTFYEGPALIELAYTVLPNASVFSGLFIFLGLLIYVEEFCIWKDVFERFKQCWTYYDKNNNMNTKFTEMPNRKLCNKNKESLNIVSKKSKDQQEPKAYSNEYNNHNTIDPITKVVKNNLSIKNRRNRTPFTEVTG